MVTCWEKIEKRFSIFEFRLGINFSHFRLGRFGEVESRLGSLEAGVEIDTGWKRALFYTFWNKAERCRTNIFRVMDFWICFYFSMQMESKSKFEKQALLEKCFNQFAWNLALRPKMEELHIYLMIIQIWTCLPVGRLVHWSLSVSWLVTICLWRFQSFFAVHTAPAQMYGSPTVAHYKNTLFHGEALYPRNLAQNHVYR